MQDQYPIFITVRDRVTALRDLVAWLESVGQERIFLLDCESSYPPLLDYLDTSPHAVVTLGANLGHRAPWESGAIDAVCGDTEYFVVTDPDVIPVEGTPGDALDVFREVLESIPQVRKAGFGLVIDDLPACFLHRAEVVEWESQFWTQALAPGIFAAPIDTTFALYRPGTPYLRQPAIRLGPPYAARHMGWYLDTEHPTDEDAWYASRALRDSTHWSMQELPAWFTQIEDTRRAAEGARTNPPSVEDATPASAAVRSRKPLLASMGSRAQRRAAERTGHASGHVLRHLPPAGRSEASRPGHGRGV